MAGQMSFSFLILCDAYMGGVMDQHTSFYGRVFCVTAQENFSTFRIIYILLDKL